MRDAVLPSTLMVVLLLLARTGEVPASSRVSNLLSATPSGECAKFRQALNAQLEPSGMAQVLIATVADPHTSGLAYGFDLTVDAIQRALAQQGYTQGGFWLPWHSEADAGPDCRERPGFIFASPSPTSDARPVLVLLVGETATTGVNVAQLRCALRLVGHALPDDGSSDPCTPPDGGSLTWTGVLGPTFSGAAPSLMRELAWDGGPVTVPIVSGSATATNLGLGPTFRRTVLSDDVVLDAMLAYLTWHQAEAQDIALLVESNTAYGSGLSRFAESRGGESSGAEPTATQAVAPSIRLKIPFPLGVHRLREDEAASTPAPVPFGNIGLPLLQDKGVSASSVPQFSSSTESFDERRLETALQSLARRKIRFIGILATNDLDKLFLARRARAFCPDATLFTLESSLLFTHPDEARVATGMLVASTYPLIPLNQEWTPWLPGNEEVLQTFGTGTAEGIFNAALVLLRGEHLADFAFPFTVTAPPPVWISVVGNGAMWPVAALPTQGRRPPEARDATPDATQLSTPSDARGPDGGFNANRKSGETQSPLGHDSGRNTAPWGAVVAFVIATGWVMLRTLSFWSVARKVASDSQGTRIPAILLPFGDLPTLMAIRETRAGLKLLPQAGRTVVKESPEALAGAKEDTAYQEAADARARAVRTSLLCQFAVVLFGYLGVAFLALVPVWAFGSLPMRGHTWVGALAGFAIAVAAFTTFGVCKVRTDEFWKSGFRRALLGGAATALLFIAVMQNPAHLTSRLVNFLLWYERSIAFSSGVTSVVPLAALWLGIYLFVRGHLQSLVNAPVAVHTRATPTEDMPNPLVEVITDRPVSRENSTNARDVLIRDLHQGSWPRWRLKDAVGPLAAAALPILVLIKLHRPTLDGWVTQALLLAGMSLTLFALAWSLHRVLSGTDALLRFLRFIAVEPGFEQLTAFFHTLPPKQYGRFQVLHPDVRLLARFSRTFGRAPEDDTPGAAAGDVELQAWAGQLSEDLRIYDRWPAWGSRTLESIRVAALGAAPWTWKRSTCHEDHGDSPRVDLVGTYLVLIVSWALTSIRNFLLLAGILSACLWVAFVSYPQSPHHLLLLAAWSAMAVCFVIGLVTFVRFERDDVLSKMSGTTEGKVTFDFAFLKSNWALLAGPVLAFVVLEFPQFGRWLSEWAEPLLRTIK
jgi:hypothetical protein